jgi:hypothetical protein
MWSHMVSMTLADPARRVIFEAPARVREQPHDLARHGPVCWDGRL